MARNGLLLPLLLLATAFSAGCGSSSPSWEDSKAGGDTATLHHFDHAKLKGEVTIKLPPCPTSAKLPANARPCVPLRCKGPDGKQLLWLVRVPADTFEIAPYGDHSEDVSADPGPNGETIHKADAHDADFRVTLGVESDFLRAGDLACGAGGTSLKP